MDEANLEPDPEPRPTFGPAVAGFAGSATVLVGLMVLLTSMAQ
jgi:hypothetical protein